MTTRSTPAAIRESTGPAKPPGRANKATLLCVLAGGAVTLAAVLTATSRPLGASTETKAVWDTRCTEDVHEEELAVGYQRAFWAAVAEGRSTNQDIKLVLNSDFCGAPAKTLCFQFARAEEATQGALTSRLSKLEAGTLSEFLERCSGEFSADEQGRFNQLR